MIDIIKTLPNEVLNNTGCMLIAITGAIISLSFMIKAIRSK